MGFTGCINTAYNGIRQISVVKAFTSASSVSDGFEAKLTLRRICGVRGLGGYCNSPTAV